MSEYLNNIKSIPITDYASRCGFALTRKGNYYSLREHDSVRIDTTKNCFWRNSVFMGRGGGGSGSIIDFAMMFSGYASAAEAIKALAEIYGIARDGNSDYVPPSFVPNVAADKKTSFDTKETGELVLPPKGKNNKAAFNYLVKVRGLDLGVVRYMHAKKMFYEDNKQNCVFVSNKFACIRGTNSNFVGDVKGNDYNECYFMRCNSAATSLIVTESVIDLMSIMTDFAKKR